MKIKLSRERYDVILVFALLFLSVSFVVSNDIISSSATIVLWMIFLFLILAGNARINLTLGFVTGCLLMLMLFTVILRDENMVVFAKNAFSFLVVYLYVSSTSFRRFSAAFVKVMKFLCVVSLVGYVLHLVVPGLFSFNVVRNMSGARFANFFVYVQWVSGGSNAFRNWGFAWEPGAFATFVCLAMLLDVFVVSAKVNLKAIALYMATTFTTLSTTGIVAIVCLCVFLIIGNESISKKTRKAVIISLLIAAAAVWAMSDVFFDLRTNSAFGKIISFLSNRNGNRSSSASIRYYSVIKVAEAFLQSPLYGWGYNGLRLVTREFTRGMNTCTFLNWFAVYGIVFGTVMLVGVSRLAKEISRKKYQWLVVLLFLFGITMTEDYIHTPIIFMLALYGYSTPSGALSSKGLND